MWDYIWWVARVALAVFCTPRRFDAGAAKQKQRKLARQQSLLRTPPTTEELAVVHDLYVRAHDQDAG